jgi:hypothetical protein
MVRTMLGVVGIVMAALASASCSGEGEGDGGLGSGGSSSGGKGGAGPIIVGGATGTGGSGVNAGGSGAAPTGCFPEPDQTGCVGEQFAGENIPVDVYVMFDQSCSMSCPVEREGPGQCCMGDPDGRIFPVREAMDLFLHDPESAGIGFGIGYFGYMPVGDTSCDEGDYEDAAVDVGLGQADAIVASLEQAEPTGETPTGAAIRGACTYAVNQRRANPERALVILLVTDGIPETPASNCGASLEDAVEAATACSQTGTNPIKIYVLGVGRALQNLDQIAAAGGTERAYLVEGGNVAVSVLEALNAIRSAAAIPCQLTIPESRSGELDYNQVNVGLCDAGGTPRPTYYVENESGCGADGGWYYDDPTNPESIRLCNVSCETVSQPGASLFYSVGCATQTEPPR